MWQLVYHEKEKPYHVIHDEDDFPYEKLKELKKVYQEQDAEIIYLLINTDTWETE
jgi:ATP sulfurylase